MHPTSSNVAMFISNLSLAIYRAGRHTLHVVVEVSSRDEAYLLQRGHPFSSCRAVMGTTYAYGGHNMLYCQKYASVHQSAVRLSPSARFECYQAQPPAVCTSRWRLLLASAKLLLLLDSAGV